MERENLLEHLKTKNDKFINQLIKINNKEKKRIEYYGFRASDSPILCTIENFVKKYEIIETKVRFIEGKVKKDSIKISFFGTVSAGKSKVLNTIIGENLFLSAVADTTSCFVAVRKSDRGRHYLRVEGSETNFDSLTNLKNKVKELTTHLSENTTGRLDTTKTVQVFLNIENEIMKNNTKIFDCPGSNNKREVTECIMQQSLDSDIFIFVMTCTLTNEEKDFFEYQSKLSSKPDIFVLVNKWDKSDQDKTAVTEKSRIKIKREIVNLLTKDGNFSSEEASKRIFFVSALEMFKCRIERKEIFGNQRTRRAIEMRYEEFLSFEESLSRYIDNPEINKLERHDREVRETTRNLESIIESFKTELFKHKDLKELKTYDMKDLSGRLDKAYECILKDLLRETKEIHMNLITNCHDLRTFLTRNNIQGTCSMLNTVTTRVSNDLMNIQSNLNKKLQTMKKDFKRVMGKHKFIKKEEKPTLKEDIKKNIVLQLIPEKSTWGHICGFFARMFGNNDDENEISEILQKHKEEITSIEKEMRNYVSEFGEKLQNYIACEFSLISDMVIKRIQYVEEFWDSMEQILK